MKKILVAILGVLFAAPSFAQYSSGGFSLSESSVYYGIRLGMNVANLTGDAPIDGTRIGLNFGGTVGLRLSDSAPVFLESGLYYTGSGASKKKNSTSLNYLEVPLLIKYGVQVSDDIALLPFIGPSFRYGIFGGKTKIDGTKYDAFGDDAFPKMQYKRADVGIKIGCGAEYNKLYLELGYQFGITNIANWDLTNGDEASAHNGALFVNLGVNF